MLIATTRPPLTLVKWLALFLGGHAKTGIPNTLIFMSTFWDQMTKTAATVETQMDKLAFHGA